MKVINFILFDEFETLDATGPAEIISKIPETSKLEYFSLNGGIVTSSQSLRINTLPLSELCGENILILPGGQGTRTLVNDDLFIGALKEIAISAEYVLTICTGSALLAKTGLLEGRRATSNKKAFEWVKSVNRDVKWVEKARWVVDGKFYTSSGVSAGIDMTLGFINDIYGYLAAKEISNNIEYIWNDNKDWDPFIKNTQ